MGTHRIKIWFIPEEVVRKIGEDTYRIKVGPRQFRERQELRVREPDVCRKYVSLDYTAHDANSAKDYAGQDS